MANESRGLGRGGDDPAPAVPLGAASSEMFSSLGSGPVDGEAEDFPAGGPNTAPIPIIIDALGSDSAYSFNPPNENVLPRRRWSLRAKLIGLVIAVAAVALIVADIALPIVVRASLMSSRDANLTAMIASLPPTVSSQSLQRSASNNPLRGEIGWTVIQRGGLVLTIPTADGAEGPVIGNADVSSPITLKAATGEPYRALSLLLSDDGMPVTLVVWSPIEDIESTLDKLVVAELVISVGLLILLGAAASLLIRRELKSLEEMAIAADQIAAGDINRRVDAAHSGVEVERLGNAFNDMLDGISALLDERQAAEARLRQFVADASHELRTPVAAVRGYTDLYAAGALPEDAAVARAMQRMGFESRRMAALVNDLLTLMQADATESMHTESVDLAELLTGVVDDAAAIDPSRVWRMAGLGAGSPGFGAGGLGAPGFAAGGFAAQVPRVLGDRLRLHQLFANLLANIRTHTPAGTAATVAIIPAGRSVVIEVSDNGPGVGTDSLAKLFDRFYREDAARSRESGGAGLGLSIVAAIVKAHGGTVSAAHAQTGGLAVRVKLPLAPVSSPL
ncbi:sensor histidine kinase [Nakamurella antarctica]|uniref:sensor histidine kinase n=1 Tax=Nakamurella antarctica TaxID=1902245 RepID=UPI0013DD882F|nr:ATP-binding protein [Nakamurella antarctica]